MWLEIFIAVLVVLFLFAKIKGSKKNSTHFSPPRPLAEVAEEEITTKVVALDAEIEIIQKSPAAEEKSNDSQQASKKDAVIVKSKIQEIEAKIKIEIERRQATSESFPFLAVCSVLDLDPNSDDLAHEFIAEVYTRLRLQGQLVGHGPHKVPEYSPVRKMLESVIKESQVKMMIL